MNTLAQATPAEPLDPLYVDVDGSLLRSNLLFESLLGVLRRAPHLLLLVPIWLMRGRAHLKAKLAEHSDLQVADLPYRTDFLDYLKQQASTGRTLILATAANEKLAKRVASHLGIFRSVLASSTHRNLKGAEKARAIHDDAAGAPFAYAGNDSSDLAIWRTARSAVLVNAPTRVAAKARRLSTIEREFPPERQGLSVYPRAMRVYQWMKNALIFVPLLTAHRWGDAGAWFATALAFGAFSLCASAIYLLNDLLDLPADRRHPRKRHRPLASGALPISHALLLMPALLCGGLALAATVGMPFLVITLLYIVITVAYSFGLKRFVLVDVITLAGLYTIRVIAGSAALEITPSFWLLAFSMSIFVSLALIKRCAELITLYRLQRSNAIGRDYQVTDLAVLQAMGIASGFASVLVLALFINSDHIASPYSRPEALWLLCGTALYWITRMWIKTARGEMHDDPLLYAARDRASLVMLGLSVLIVLVAR